MKTLFKSVDRIFKTAPKNPHRAGIGHNTSLTNPEWLKAREEQRKWIEDNYQEVIKELTKR